MPRCRRCHVGVLSPKGGHCHLCGADQEARPPPDQAADPAEVDARGSPSAHARRALAGFLAWQGAWTLASWAVLVSAQDPPVVPTAVSVLANPFTVLTAAFGAAFFGTMALTHNMVSKRGPSAKVPRAAAVRWGRLGLSRASVGSAALGLASVPFAAPTVLELARPWLGLAVAFGQPLGPALGVAIPLAMGGSLLAETVFREEQPGRWLAAVGILAGLFSLSGVAYAAMQVV